MLASGGDYDYLRTAPEAGLNTIACGTWGFPLAERMKERFGTPYVYHELPLGVEATSRFVRDLAKATGREEEGERFIKREFEAIKDVWEKCKEMVAGRTVILGGIGNRAASYLRLCKELGMEVIYIPAYPDMGGCHDEHIKGKRVDWDYFLEYGFDPMVLRLREGVLRDYRLYYLPRLMDRLGLNEDEVIYMYCDLSAYAGRIEPARIAYMNSSTHLRRRAGYPTRAVGFRGTEGWCLDLMDAVKVAKRKTSPTLYTRIYAR
jgi:nitrogenase molybdenum-iron protein alpha/beta subunit